jgi:hypothetical protein
MDEERDKMTEYNIHEVASITGLAMSSIRKLHALHGLGYHKNARKLIFTSADLKQIFQLSDKARLYRAAKRSGYTR